MTSQIISDIQKRLHEQNKNWLCAVIGPTGSGKSYLSMRLCKQIDPSFGMHRVTFTPDEFLKVLEKKPKKGSAIMLEEAGVAVDSRTWYDRANRAINYVMQTFRRENLAVVLTTPSLNFVDKNVRRLMHNQVETVRIDRRSNVCYTKFLNVQYNPRLDKRYLKHNKRAGRVKVTRVGFKLPPKGLVKKYEEKKKAYCDALLREQQDMIKQDKKDAKRKKEKADIQPIIEEVTKNYKEYLSTHNDREYVDPILIMTKHGIGEARSRGVKKLVEKELRKKGVL